MGPVPTRITGPAFTRAGRKKSWAQPAAWAGKGKKGRRHELAGLWLLGQFAGYQAEGGREERRLGPERGGVCLYYFIFLSFIPKPIPRQVENHFQNHFKNHFELLLNFIKTTQHNKNEFSSMNAQPYL